MMKLDALKAAAPAATEYLDLAGQSIMSATLAFDYARSAEKMVDPNCAGAANPAWQTGPFLSTFQNAQEVSRDAPSVLRVSIEANVASQIVYGQADKDSAINLPQDDAGHNQVEHILARLAIIEQFTLLQNFLAARPKWQDTADHETVTTVQQITDRYAELLNDHKSEETDMREAIDIFCAAAQCAAEIANSGQ